MVDAWKKGRRAFIDPEPRIAKQNSIIPDESAVSRAFQGEAPAAAAPGVSFSITPLVQTASEGDSLSFRISINNPNYPAVGSYRIYWRTNATASHAASSSDYQSFTTLQAVTFSASSAQSFTFSIRTNTDGLTEGTEYFEVDLYDFQQAYLAGSATVFTILDVEPAKPDLVIGGLSLGASSVQAGTGISVSFSIVNDGNASASASTAKLYISRNSTLDSSDVLLQSFSIPSLAAGRSQTGSVSVPLPDNWATGTSYIIIVADTANSVAESNEANNSFGRSFSVVAPARPDLVIGSLTLGATSVQAGTGISVSFSIVNDGDASAAASTARLYISHDQFLDANDTPLQSFAISALGAGQADTRSISVALPANWGTGTSYIIVAADTGNVVTEVSEANNSFGRSFTIVAPITQPDLVIGGLTLGTTSGQAGSGLSVSFSIANAGNAIAAASTARLYISHDQFLDANDTQLQSFAIPSLGAGASDSRSLSVALPSVWSPGTSYIIIATDTGNVVAESNEANNSYGRPFTITTPILPDLVIGSLSLTSSSVQVGTGISVSFSIVNSGNASAGASTAMLYLSTDPYLDAGDTPLQAFGIGALAASQSQTTSLSIPLPQNWPVGSGYLIVAADIYGHVAESNELNNSYSRPLTVEPVPLDTIVHGDPITEMVRLAVDAYGNGTSAASRGWHPLSAIELGFLATSPGNGGLTFSYSDGWYRATGSALNEADALVMRAMIGGVVTLAISFRGTDEIFPFPSDFVDYVDFDTHYAKFAPLIAAIDSYLSNPAHGIEQVLVSGHSLGAAMVQHFMAASGHGSSLYRAVTIGSPGGDNSGGRDDDPRIMNIGHTDDAVFLLTPLASSTFGRAALTLALPPELAPLISSIQAKERQGSTVYIDSSVSSVPLLTEHDRNLYLSDFLRLSLFASDPESPFHRDAVGAALAASRIYSGPPVYIALGNTQASTDRIIPITARDDWALGSDQDDRFIWEFPIGPGSQLHKVDGGLGQDTVVLTGFQFLWDFQSNGSVDLLTYDGRSVGELSRVERIVFSFSGATTSSSAGTAAGASAIAAANLGTMVVYLDGRATAVQTPTSGQTSINVDTAYDYLAAGDGSLTIAGSGGDDIVLLGRGTQSVDGSAGNDIITASVTGGLSFGTLLVRGGSGNDLITGDGDNPTRLIAIFSGARADYSVTVEDDRIVVSDLRSGSPDGTDTLQKVDVLRFADGDFTANQLLGMVILGDEQANSLTGGSGKDSIVGNGGDDVISGGAGNDHLYGDAGNDILFGGSGVDYMAGGAGNDWYYVDDSNDYVAEGIGEGVADHIFTSTSYTMAAGVDVEILSAADETSTAPLSLAGNEFDNIIRGNAGDNNLFGLGGVDELVGLGGNDTYVVDNALDRVIEVAGEGRDILFSSVTYTLAADAAIDVMATADPNGTAAINLFGNGFAQQIFGNAGDNLLDGGAGADTLIGNAGNDVLRGGGGYDQLYGGAGADIFVYLSIGDSTTYALRSDGKQFAPDMIWDFVTGEDKLDLSAIDADTKTAQNDAFNFIGYAAFTSHAGELRGFVDSNGVHLVGDVDGDGLADFQINVAASIYVADMIL